MNDQDTEHAQLHQQELEQQEQWERHEKAHAELTKLRQEMKDDQRNKNRV